jgi:hypothetical protein
MQTVRKEVWAVIGAIKEHQEEKKRYQQKTRRARGSQENT